MKDIKWIMENVEGMFSMRECKRLYELAKNCKGKGVIVEIGSWKGRSTCCLRLGSKEGVTYFNTPIFAIDPHTGSEEHRKELGKVWTFTEFTENIRKAGVSHLIYPKIMTSEEARKSFTPPIELLFIDGAHDYESVKKDFELWFPSVVDGGIIAFHDAFGFPGVEQVIKEKVYDSIDFKNPSYAFSLFSVQKGKAKTKDRIRMRAIQATYPIWGWIYCTIWKAQCIIRDKTPDRIKRAWRRYGGVWLYDKCM